MGGGGGFGLEVLEDVLELELCVLEPDPVLELEPVDDCVLDAVLELDPVLEFEPVDDCVLELDVVDETVLCEEAPPPPDDEGLPEPPHPITTARSSRQMPAIPRRVTFTRIPKGS